MSNQLGILAPPLQVTLETGAVGKTIRQLFGHNPSFINNSENPSAVSPRPCKNMSVY